MSVQKTGSEPPTIYKSKPYKSKPAPILEFQKSAPSPYTGWPVVDMPARYACDRFFMIRRNCVYFSTLHMILFFWQVLSGLDHFIYASFLSKYNFSYNIFSLITSFFCHTDFTVQPSWYRTVSTSCTTIINMLINYSAEPIYKPTQSQSINQSVNQSINQSISSSKT